jgi:precorrin-6A/cobalt-precorrin-6A reductase
MTPRRLLILGGTGEAAALARTAVERFRDRLDVATSLAGRTSAPAALTGRVRIGGFGGVEGLAAYLRDRRIDLLIDATHPFAAVMSAHARLAAEAAGIERLTLARPAWPRHPRDRWVEVADMAAAAAALPRLGRRAFITVGANEIAAFAGLAQVWMLVRLVEPPQVPLPLARHQLMTDKGPFTVTGETALMENHGIDVLVTKASGGAATAAKIEAARARDLPVLMVRRPPPEPGVRVDSVGEALDWIAARLA